MAGLMGFDVSRPVGSAGQVQKCVNPNPLFTAMSMVLSDLSA